MVSQRVWLLVNAAAQLPCRGFTSSCAPPKQALTTVFLYLTHNGSFFWHNAARNVCKVTAADATVVAEATGLARLAQRHVGKAGAADFRAGCVSDE